MPTEQEHDLPMPDRLFQSIGDAEVDKSLMAHDEDIRFVARRVPGGRYAFELSIGYEYIGYDCRMVIDLDADGARALRDAINETLVGVRE